MIAGTIFAFAETSLVSGEPPFGTPPVAVEGTPQNEDIDILDLLGSESDGADEEGLWSASVGETKFSMLNDGNVGDILFRGNLTTTTVVDDAGMPHDVTTCTGIPEIKVSNEFAKNTPGSPNIELQLDFIRCIVVVSKIATAVAVERTESHDEFELPIGYRYIETYNDPDLYLAVSRESLNVGWAMPVSDVPFFHVDYARVSANVETIDFMKNLLTVSKIWIDYASSPLRFVSYNSSCEAKSPAEMFGVIWENESCTSGPVVNGSDHFTRGTEGIYDASIEAGSGSEITEGDPRHTSSSELRVSTNQLKGTCEWDPASLLNLRVLVDAVIVYFGPNGVGLSCEIEYTE